MLGRATSHQRAREHFWQIFFISLFTFGAFLAGMAAMELIIFAIARVVGWGYFARFSSLAGVVGYVVIAGILSWFGMAIPLILGGKFERGRRLSEA